MRKHKSRTGTRATVSGAPAREAPDDPHRLAREYLSLRWRKGRRQRRLIFWRDGWWLWERRAYRELPDSELRAEVTIAVKWFLDRAAKSAAEQAEDDGNKPKCVIKVTRSLVSDVLQALKPIVLVRGTVEQPEWIGFSGTGVRFVAVANGLIRPDRLIAGRADAPAPHSPNWFSSVCLPYAYNPRAGCPQWIAFLREILEDDQERIDLLQEWFGYCLIADTSFHKFLILVGDGANGKDVILDVLVSLLGNANVSHVPLELFGERFQLTSTLGKLANVVSEIGPMNVVAEGHLKAFVAGNAMHFDRKNQPAINRRPTARVVLATNALPPFADRSSGLWRRLIVLPCNVTIPLEKQDLQLPAKLVTELPGVLNWSLDGLRRLKERGQFTEPTLCRRMLDECRAECNPARAFLLERVRHRVGAKTLCRTLYETYEAWCREEGYRPVSNRQFGKEVLRVFSNAHRQRAGGGRQDARPYWYLELELLPDDGQTEAV